MHVGTPAGTPREVVDNAYGVALVIEFADAAAHDVYQDHPDHHRFIAACSPLWSRVQVYDSVAAARQ
jgi:quinol monooxygenase YgiN